MIKSTLSKAKQLTRHIQTTSAQAGTLQDVVPVSNVTVTVNQECLNAYTTGQATFARYKAVANRDASYIEDTAVVIQNQY